MKRIVLAMVLFSSLSTVAPRPAQADFVLFPTAMLARWLLGLTLGYGVVAGAGTVLAEDGGKSKGGPAETSASGDARVSNVQSKGDRRVPAEEAVLMDGAGNSISSGQTSHSAN